jgi:hypothetical protein
VTGQPTPPRVFNSPPVNLVSTQSSYTVPLPTGAPADLGYALIVNSSGVLINVDQGGRPLGPLAAGVSNAYPLSGGGAPIGLTIGAGQTLPTGTAAQQVFVSWSDTEPPGSYPAGVNTQQIAAAISGVVSTSIFGQSQLLGSQLVDFTTGTNKTITVAIPAGTESLAVTLVLQNGPLTGHNRIWVTGTAGGGGFSGYLASPDDIAVVGPANGLADSAVVDVVGGSASWVIGLQNIDSGVWTPAPQVLATVTAYPFPASMVRAKARRSLLNPSLGPVLEASSTGGCFTVDAVVNGGPISGTLIPAPPAGRVYRIRKMQISPLFTGIPTAGTFAYIADLTNTNVRYLQKIIQSATVGDIDFSKQLHCDFFHDRGLQYGGNLGAGNQVDLSVDYELYASN